MQIKEEEQQLFSEWKVMHPNLVTDGVVNEQHYIESNRKILFLMKEVNDLTGKFKDLSDFLRSGGRPQTWDNATRWIIGLRRLEEFVSWSELAEIGVESRKVHLNTICVVNIKKVGGGHTTDNRTLLDHAKLDYQLLNRQITLYNPDIIICCGSPVSWFLSEYIKLPNQQEWKKTSRGVGYRQFGSNQVAIAYSHPEARVMDCLLFYGLIDAVREILISYRT